MTTPSPQQQQSNDGGSVVALVSQVLVEQGKLGAQLAVMDEKLKAVPDHESRIRSIESVLPINLEPRLSTLETNLASQAAVSTAATRSKAAIWTAVGAIAAAASAIAYVVMHVGGH